MGFCDRGGLRVPGRGRLVREVELIAERDVLATKDVIRVRAKPGHGDGR